MQMRGSRKYLTNGNQGIELAAWRGGQYDLLVDRMNVEGQVEKQRKGAVKKFWNAVGPQRTTLPQCSAVGPGLQGLLAVATITQSAERDSDPAKFLGSAQ